MVVKTISLVLMVPTQYNKKKLTSDSCACKINSKSATLCVYTQNTKAVACACKIGE